MDNIVISFMENPEMGFTYEKEFSFNSMFRGAADYDDWSEYFVNEYYQSFVSMKTAQRLYQAFEKAKNDARDEARVDLINGITNAAICGAGSKSDAAAHARAWNYTIAYRDDMLTRMRADLEKQREELKK